MGVCELTDLEDSRPYLKSGDATHEDSDGNHNYEHSYVWYRARRTDIYFSLSGRKTHFQYDQRQVHRPRGSEKDVKNTQSSQDRPRKGLCLLQRMYV